MPTIGQTNRDHAKRAAKQIKDSKKPPNDPIVGIWHWINGVASGVSHFLGHTLHSFGEAILFHLQHIVATFQEEINAAYRIIFWWERIVWHTIKSWIAKQYAQLRAYVKREVAYLIRLIYVATRAVLALALAAVRQERHDRKVAVGRAEARARAQIKALHGVIEREAASGYRINRDDRASLIVRLLDYAVIRNPEVKALVGKIATGLLDLLAIDDPILRILLGFLIKHVIDKLGIDKAVGVLISDLLAPLLGKPKPADLHDVIMDLSDRALALEKFAATFMEDGGAQVEQAGKDWREITGVLGNVAILAFTVQAVVAPKAWASEIDKTVGRVVNDTVLGAERLFKGL